MIIIDFKGFILVEVKEKLVKDMYYVKEVVIFIGLWEGILRGFFRFVDYVVDLVFYMMFVIEYGILVMLVFFWEVYEEFFRKSEEKS